MWFYCVYYFLKLFTALIYCCLCISLCGPYCVCAARRTLDKGWASARSFQSHSCLSPTDACLLS